MLDLTRKFLNEIKRVLYNNNYINIDQLKQIELSLDKILKKDNLEIDCMDKLQNNFITITSDKMKLVTIQDRNNIREEKCMMVSPYKVYNKNYDNEYLVFPKDDNTLKLENDEMYIVFMSKEEPAILYDRFVCENYLEIYHPEFTFRNKKTFSKVI